MRANDFGAVSNSSALKKAMSLPRWREPRDCRHSPIKYFLDSRPPTETLGGRLRGTSLPP